METLYDITKRLSNGKGESVMWETIKMVSGAVENSMPDKDKSELMSKVYGMLSGGHFDEDHAVDVVSKMYYIDKDRSKRYGPYWTIPQVMEVYEKVKERIPSAYNEWDFFVTLQMQKSDMCPLLQHWFPNATAEEMDAKLVELAVN